MIVKDVNMVLVGDTFVGRPDPDAVFIERSLNG